MSADDILLETEEKFEKALHSLEHEFRRIRTGRASPTMLDHVQVEAYGAMMPLNQVSSISVPEPTQLVIKPYDKSTLHAIEKGLINANLGMAPQNDGEIIRLNLPPLSEERRKQLAGVAKDAAEKCKIGMRNVRRDGIKAVEADGKDSSLSEDAIKGSVEQVTELLKEYEGKVEAALEEKVEDILNI